MRTETQIQKLVLDFALNDARIRAILLNGSRANPKAIPDSLQDFDLVFIVDQLESFLENPNWIQLFGDKIIYQLPNEINFSNSNLVQEVSYSYLMLFDDTNRIDLTLFPKKNLISDFKIDSQTILWLDKDGLFANVPSPNDSDYYIKKPSEKEFLDTCNEFWWVGTYVAKGLLRNEITYMMETVVRPMFMKILEWKIGIEYNFQVSFGKSGKNLINFVDNKLYKNILLTYSNHEIEENWKSLLLMIEIFSKFSNEIASKLIFNIDKKQESNTIKYLTERYKNGI